MAKISKGLIYKKVKGVDGKHTVKVPFLPKSLSSLVSRPDGTTVEDSLEVVDKIKDAKTYAAFNNKEEYDEAIASGTIKEGVLAIIPRDNVTEETPNEPEEDVTE